VEVGVADDTLGHGVVSGADDAAHIVCTFDRCRTSTVFNDSLESIRNRTNFHLFSGVANHNIAFNRTIADSHDEARTGRGVAIASTSCYQAGFQGLGAAFQRNIVQDNSTAGQAHTGETVDQACAFNLFSINIQVLDRRTVNAAQQGLFACRNCQQFIVSVNRTGELGSHRTNRCPVRRQRNIVCDLEVGPGEGIAVSNHLLDFRQMLRCLDDVGVLFRTSAVHGRLTICEVDFQDVRLRGYRFDGRILVFRG